MAGSEGRWTPVLLSRIAGLSALVTVLSVTLYNGFISPPLGPPEPSSQRILAWVSSNQQVLLSQYVRGYVAILFGVLIVILVALNGGRGILGNLALLGAGADIAITLTGAGLYDGLWTFVQRGGSDSSVVALFSIAESYNHASLMAMGLAVGSVSALSLHKRSLPRWLGWLGILMGAEYLVTNLVFAAYPAFSTTTAVFTLGALARILNIALGFAWLISVGVLLLVRPRRQTAALTAG